MIRGVARTAFLVIVALAVVFAPGAAASDGAVPLWEHQERVDGRLVAAVIAPTFDADHLPAGRACRSGADDVQPTCAPVPAPFPPSAVPAAALVALVAVAGVRGHPRAAARVDAPRAPPALI